MRAAVFRASSWQAKLMAGARAASDPHVGLLLDDGGRGVHLAVMVEPYLSLLLCGVKTVESRFGVSRREPWDRVSSGDVVLLKRSSGPVVGIAEVGRVWQFRIPGDALLDEVREQFDGRVRGTPEFWRSLGGARYATLWAVARVHPVKPIACEKRDRRGWVVLRAAALSTAAQSARGAKGR